MKKTKITKKTNTITVYREDYIGYLRFRGFDVPDDSEINTHTTFADGRMNRFALLSDVVNGISVTWTTEETESNDV